MPVSGNVKLNIYILSGNALIVNGLRHSIEDKFRRRVNVRGFYNRKSCLKQVNERTDIIVLDHLIEGKESSFTIRQLKRLNSGTEVVMNTGNEEVLQSIGSLINKNMNFVRPGEQNGLSVRLNKEGIIY